MKSPLSDDEIVICIAAIEASIDTLEQYRRLIQFGCRHARTKTAYETEPGDREGLSGEYVDRCQACGKNINERG